ncbi:MAG: multidrug effflux MFS transporter [Burkholderiaceae bacterium]
MSGLNPAADQLLPAPSRETLIILLGQIAFGLLAMTICLPSMPSWLDSFNEPQARVQLTFSAYLVGFALTQLIYGPLSDNFGRRRVLVAGLVIGVLGSLAGAMASSLNELIAARALQGAGTCAGMVVGRAIIQDTFAAATRTRVMAFVGVVMGSCPPLGTLIGGQLHVYFGWRSTFIVIAALGIALVVASLMGLAPGRPLSRRRSLLGMASSYVSLVREPSYLSYCLVAGFASGAFYIFLGMAPTVLGSYGVGPASIGWYILMVPGSYIAGNALTARLAQSVSGKHLMFVGQALTVTGVVLVWVLALSDFFHPLAVALPLMLLGFGHGLLMPPTLSGLVGVIPALAGAGAALAGMMQQALGAVGSYSAGFVDSSNAAGMAGLMLIFTLIGLAAQIPLATHKRR